MVLSLKYNKDVDRLQSYISSSSSSWPSYISIRHAYSREIVFQTLYRPKRHNTLSFNYLNLIYVIVTVNLFWEPFFTPPMCLFSPNLYRCRHYRLISPWHIYARLTPPCWGLPSWPPLASSRPPPISPVPDIRRGSTSPGGAHRHKIPRWWPPSPPTLLSAIASSPLPFWTSLWHGAYHSVTSTSLACHKSYIYIYTQKCQKIWILFRKLFPEFHEVRTFQPFYFNYF